MGNEESRGRGHRVKKGECVCVCVCVHACWLIWGIERGYVWPSWCLAQICHCMLDAMERSMKISNDPGRAFVCAHLCVCVCVLI